MGVLETLAEALGMLQEQINLVHTKLDNLKLESEEEEIWQRKDLEEFTKFKYINVRDLTDRRDFPKFYIGKTECYLKSEVINYLRKISYEHQQTPKESNKTSKLYSV